MMSSGDLMCSICLDVFNDPVSTPCGHNFCKICLSSYWNNSQDYRCPNCNETFDQKPDLRINTTLRDLVDEHKKKSNEEQAEAEVVCDICTEGKLKAVKSCLVCQISYCETHLESHLRVSGLQKHKLIDPVKNLQDYICQKHDRPLELFCRDDHTCVCLSCTEGDHKNHNTVPIRESELEEMMDERQTGAETQDEYVIKYLEQEISEMKKKNIKLQMIAEKQRAAETQDKCLIKDLKKEITKMQWRNNELEMVKQKHITAENVIKVRDQEITDLKKRNTELKERDDELEMKDAELMKEITELKKRNTELKKRDDELEMKDAELMKEITELKKRNTELKKRDAELVMVNQKQMTVERQYEKTIKDRDQEITELKKRNTELKKRDAELKMVKQKQIIAENVITVRDQEITELKNRNIELKKREDEVVMLNYFLKEYIDDNNFKAQQIRCRDRAIIELSKRDTELVMVKQIQITSENVIKVRDQEIMDLKKRNTEQQQKISNTEDNLRLLQGENQEYLSRLQMSSSEDLCSRIVGVVLFLLYIIASVLKWMQQYAVDVTLDPDTAHPKLILSDDEKQVTHGDNPERFETFSGLQNGVSTNIVNCKRRFEIWTPHRKRRPNPPHNPQTHPPSVALHSETETQRDLHKLYIHSHSSDTQSRIHSLVSGL